ncbi:hypothetical protein FKG94_00845 [Exilibacterium tricleocarpae]|uniref:Uncharacterized protein n=1 Tax=Exilibacterium tricleocarpae TaxID=2591008 RepID=A0A545U9I7_9GAMM|nr:hypothetical protein [Exilibacterium tricleocarpae]TQV86136.1 hypothetical protein FKG94_00845 [Exilibacterium tricleocarpae]
MKSRFTTDRSPRQLTYLIGLFFLIQIQPAPAFSCMPFDLQRNYENFHSVLVAEILACSVEIRENAQNTRTCSINATDIFKGEARDFVIDGSHAFYEKPLVAGESYLLFLNEDGLSPVCSGKGIVDPEARKVSLKEVIEATNAGDTAKVRLRQHAYFILTQLKKLRDYRDGKRTGLKDYWLFEDNGYHCSLTQLNNDLSELRIDIRFSYNDDFTKSSTEFPIKQIIPQTEKQVQPALGNLQMSIYLPHPVRIQDKPGELIIDGTSYLFKPRLEETYLPTEPLELLSQNSSYHIYGQPATDILARLERQPEIKFRTYIEETNSKGNAISDDRKLYISSKPMPKASTAVVNGGYEYPIDTFGIDEALSKFVACRKTWRLKLKE